MMLEELLQLLVRQGSLAAGQGLPQARWCDQLPIASCANKLS
jgi:hypothetical protein